MIHEYAWLIWWVALILSVAAFGPYGWPATMFVSYVYIILRWRAGHD